MNRKLLIFAAVHIEARAIAEALDGIYSPRSLPTRLKHHDLDIELHTVGIRAIRLPRNLARQSTCGILMAGLAGALDPSLQVGDVILDNSPHTWTAATGLRQGKIHTAGDLIATPAGKADLLRQTGALAVDMETDIVRQLAADLGVPFLSVRAISDTAQQTLDPMVLQFIDEMGNPRPAALMAGLLRQPNLLGYLSRLQAATTLASQRLGQAVRKILSTRQAQNQWQ